jgi:trehalose/maltose transport system substrate-binding protein
VSWAFFQSNFTGRNFQIVALPSGPKAPSKSCLGGWNLAINNFSPNKDAAWKFIHWMLQEDAQQYLAVKESLVEPR